MQKCKFYWCFLESLLSPNHECARQLFLKLVFSCLPYCSFINPILSDKEIWVSCNKYGKTTGLVEAPWLLVAISYQLVRSEVLALHFLEFLRCIFYPKAFRKGLNGNDAYCHTFSHVTNCYMLAYIVSTKSRQRTVLGLYSCMRNLIYDNSNEWIFTFTSTYHIATAWLQMISIYSYHRSTS